MGRAGVLNIVVGVADMKVSSNPESILVTHSLGSCIGVAVYDRVARVGGMLHFMLPDSGIDPVKAQSNPSMFADTGIPHLFKSVYALGGKKNQMKVVVAGGAQANKRKDFFNIGKRNFMAVRKMFWKNNVIVDYQHVGGGCNRTIRMFMNDGKVWLKVSGEGVIEI